ncbi:MAG: N-acetylglucosamine-6-phosphate deacetylase [Caldilineaceae bacterium]|nr:N-acetylglucosamine-6-phosphate deacetylase [Caldilineaceae bacterium]
MSNRDSWQEEESPLIGGIAGLTGRTVFGVAAAPPGQSFSLTFRDGEVGGWQSEGAIWEGSFVDGSGCTLLPGFIDVHIHGSGGADVMDATPESLETMSRFLVRHGVTGFYATTVTASREATLAAVENAARYVESSRSGNGVEGAAGARVLGVHLEGPFLSAAFPGAQNPAHIRPPSAKEFEELLGAGPVRMITLAPEVAGADTLIGMAAAAGVRVVMGHTGATFEEATSAMEAGVSQATHTYNAMTGLHHRRPGAVGATLSDDRIYAQLIADGIHVHPAAMRILGRCKGPARTLLISDAIGAAGMAEGRYEMGRLPVIVKDGACRLEDGTLAGSVLTLDAALRNFMSATGWPLVQAWPATSLSQAQAMGIDREVGRIRRGARADLVLLDSETQVAATVVGGRLAYLRDSWRLQG